MLVHVLNSKTNRVWFGHDPDDPNRSGRSAACRNSAGVRCGKTHGTGNWLRSCLRLRSFYAI